MVLPFPTVGSLVIRSGQDIRSDPCISSVATSIMITSSNSSVKRSGLPNQLLGVGLHITACSELARVRTELFHLLVIPPLAPHPIQSNRQTPRHRHPWRSSFLAAWPGGNTCYAIPGRCVP